MLRLARFLGGRENHSISISFDSDLAEDGLGAQLQRQFSLKALAYFLRIAYVPTLLKQIAIHPLDDFKNANQMQDFLHATNDLFGFVIQDVSQYSKIAHIRILTIWNLTKFILLARISNRHIHLRVLEAYSLVDVEPKMYSDSLEKFELNLDSLDINCKFLETDICIHYRQGVGGNTIYPGQSISRELNPQYFIGILNRLETEGKTITVFTDAPEQDIEFTPDITQEHLWVGTPGFRNGKVKIKALNLKAIFTQSGYEVNVVSGGDLLETLLTFVNCETLLMSRSSLSYVAALLNANANIYFPPNFWHPPLEHWTRVN
jgi:hypothetical protein